MTDWGEGSGNLENTQLAELSHRCTSCPLDLQLGSQRPERKPLHNIGVFNPGVGQKAPEGHPRGAESPDVGQTKPTTSMT